MEGIALRERDSEAGIEMSVRRFEENGFWSGLKIRDVGSWDDGNGKGVVVKSGAEI